MEKYRINKLNGAFWFVPSIFTASKRKWVPRPATSFKLLLEREKLLRTNALISFNRDKYLSLFKTCLQIKKWGFSFSSKDIQDLKNNVLIVWIFGETKLVWTKKALETLYKGYVPFVDFIFLEEMDMFDQRVAFPLTWTASGFKVYNQKLPEDVRSLHSSRR